MIDHSRNNGVNILKQLSPQDFRALGVQQIAYIRPVMVNGAIAYSINAADGTQLAIHGDQKEALALTRQNELQPLTLH
jgi:hypothetical protein